jgi:hypothetical protein
MAGKLVQVATETVTSAVASVTLTGIDSDDVYMVACSGLVPATDGARIYLRVTKSGTADTTANYDQASKFIRTSTTFGNSTATNGTYFDMGTIGNATGEENDWILYLYNFNSSSEYSFATFEQATLSNSAELRGLQGGGVHTVASASNGISILFSTGNISAGTVTLFKVV